VDPLTSQKIQQLTSIEELRAETYSDFLKTIQVHALFPEDRGHFTADLFS
jgi:hypothetical protein